MSSKPEKLVTTGLSEVAPATDAGLEKFLNELHTRPIGPSAMDIYWSSRKADLQQATEQSSVWSKNNTVPLISEFSSKQTTTAQNSSEKDTQTGQSETGLFATSEKQSLPPGVIGTPYGNLQFYGENPKNPILPTDPKARKKVPLWSGLVKYFPDALAAVAAVSYQGNEQHNPGKPLHWDRSKSMDQQDTLLRHMWESGTVDVDGHLHSAKVAWRALAMLQLELETNAN